MNPTASNMIAYTAILSICAVIYASSTAQDRVEKFLNRCDPIHARISFSYVTAAALTIIAFITPIASSFFLVGVGGFLLIIPQLLVYRCFETLAVSLYLSSRYIRPYRRDYPEMAKYYEKVFTWLKSNPMVIKEADSEDDLIAIYEQKTGDDSYSKDNERVIPASIFETKTSQAVPYNVMNAVAKSSNRSTSDKQKKETIKKDASSGQKKRIAAKEEEKKKYCQNCGAKYKDPDAKYCSQCGEKIKK